MEIYIEDPDLGTLGRTSDLGSGRPKRVGGGAGGIIVKVALRVSLQKKILMKLCGIPDVSHHGTR